MRKYAALAVILIPSLFPATVFALDAGEKAPLFRAPSTHGPLDIGDFRGKRNVVLAYYYRDFTPV